MKSKSMPCPSPGALRECLEAMSDPNPQLAAHLESCSHCQATMSFVAGQETWWDEAQQFLSCDVDPIAGRISSRVCPLTSSELETTVGSDVLLAHELQQLQSLLDAPSHPELLGRIGRYELEQLVGRGGMGLVFRAHDTELHRVVAIKTLALHLIPIGAARERFVRESRACAALAHPHIVPMYDVVHDGPVPALVMQYIAGPTLQAWVREHGSMAWQDALKIGSQLADALAAAHSNGLVHRDIKPGNVLLEANGSRALLTDFGLARVLDAATMTQSGILTGTPEYMSPEQANGASVDERSDLFSLGSLIYTMLAGTAPFRAAEPMAILHRVCNASQTPLHRINPEIPIEVSRLVDRLLAKNPQHRFASAQQLRDAMLELLRSPRRLLRSSRPRMVRWVTTIVVVAGFFLLIGLFEPIRMWIGTWSEASSSTQTSNPVQIQMSHDVTNTDFSETMSLPNSSGWEKAIESAFGNTVGVFDDFHAIDRELSSLTLESQRMLRALESPQVKYSDAAFPIDPIDPEVTRLKEDTQRLESELKP